MPNVSQIQYLCYTKQIVILCEWTLLNVNGSLIIRRESFLVIPVCHKFNNTLLFFTL